MPTDHVSNTYFRDLLACWEQYGHDKQALVKGAGVSLAHIENPAGSVALAAFQRIMHNAAHHPGAEGFALHLGQQLTPNAHGTLGLAFLSSKNVDNALSVLEKYASIQTNLLQFSVRRDGRGARLVIEESQPLGSAYVPVLELALSTVWFALRLLSGGQLSCAGVSVRFPAPAHQPLYHTIFQCSPTFGADENSLSITLDGLKLPLLLANPQAMQRAIAQCDEALLAHGHRESLTQRIRRRLLRSPGAFPDMQRLCDEFAMSERSLRRKLADEGVSFQSLLNDTRKQLAERYLRETPYTIAEIAWLLGYNDPSNFGNAFKRWHGQAPSEYRETFRHVL